jgi:hypothetical protein
LTFTLSDTILNEKLCGWIQTTHSFFKKSAKGKSVMGKEPNGHQPGPPDLQTPVMAENDETVVVNLLNFSASPFSD